MPYTTWLPQSNRSSGQHNTPSVTVPSDIDTIRVHLLINPTAFETPDKSLSVAIEVSTDDGQTWTPAFTVGWVGGPEPTRPGQHGWYAAVNGIATYAGALARARLSQSGSFRWGLEGEIL